MLRTCLIVSILAGGSLIALNHFAVRPRLQELINQREANARDRDAEKAAKTKALNDLKTTTAQLREKETALGQAEARVSSAEAQTESQTRLTASLREQLSKLDSDYKASRQELARWDGLGVDPAQAKQVMAASADLHRQNQTLQQALRTAMLQRDRFSNIVDQVFAPGDRGVILPAGLKGKVLAVDPKWHFVVLDIGEKQGALKGGMLTISRENRLVGKVRIASVETDRSIANLVSGWNLAEVMEGDRAFN